MHHGLLQSLLQGMPQGFVSKYELLAGAKAVATISAKKGESVSQIACAVCRSVIIGRKQIFNHADALASKFSRSAMKR